MAAEAAAAAAAMAASGQGTDNTASAGDKEDGVNFGLSGKLLEDTNTVNGVVVKYSEPPEARDRFYKTPFGRKLFG
jgi:hypothetical protein